MDASNADDLVASADSALYRAKAAGKNRVESCSDERRGNARYAARLPGRLRVLDQTALAVNTLDISEGGFLFSAPRALPVGGLVLLELTLPGRRTLDCTARVVRVIEREQDHELGVKVIHAEGVHLNRLRSLVATLRREKSGEGRSAGTTVRLTRRQRHGA